MTNPFQNKLQRRSLLVMGSALALSRPLRAANSQPERLALHALSRLGYGPRPGDLARLGATGFDWTAYVEQQLQPAQLPLPAALQGRLDALAATAQPLGELLRAFRDAQANSQKDEARRDERRLLVESQRERAAEARLLPALISPRQLEERLVEFWFNHFNVFIGKGPVRVMLADYEARAIRPHVLGRFRDLLGATAQHPAMLFYLDNHLSSAENTRKPMRRALGLNENYARELMELHTLGVDGAYTQADVTTLARVLTGWSISPGGGFRFDERRHDDGPKTWLGQRVPGSGQAQGQWALDQLARHPRTAQRIARKLAQHFVADEPDVQLVRATADTFLATDGDLRATTRTLLLHPLARSEVVQGAQFKTPYRFTLSLLRALGEVPADETAWRPVLAAMSQLGQPLFGCVTPDGYKTTRAAWLDPEALARRAELATRLAERAKPELATLLNTLGPSLSPATRNHLTQQPARLQASLLLASPDFQNT